MPGLIQRALSEKQDKDEDEKESGDRLKKLREKKAPPAQPGNVPQYITGKRG